LKGGEIDVCRELPEYGGKAGRFCLSDYLSPGKVSHHIVQFHQILRLPEIFHTNPIHFRQPNTLLLNDNSKLLFLSVLGRLFAFIFPILIISSNSEATIMADIMTVMRIMVIIILLKNAQEASA
jgi:hypothetical protein